MEKDQNQKSELNENNEMSFGKLMIRLQKDENDKRGTIKRKKS